jgi:hypothetical protein
MAREMAHRVKFFLIGIIRPQTFANDFRAPKQTLEDVRKATRFPGILKIIERDSVKEQLIR